MLIFNLFLTKKTRILYIDCSGVYRPSSRVTAPLPAGMDDGRRTGSKTLATVNLPPLHLPKGGVPPLPTRPGSGVRLRPPTPPPRPDATLSPPPGRVEGSGLLFSSQAGRLLPSLQSPASPSSTLLPTEQPITLTNPRTLRQQNVYVDTPIKGLSVCPAAVPPLTTAKQRPRTLLPKQSSNPTTVINQPTSSLCKKPAASLPASPTDSIICGGCGRCRCEACRSPRPLPSSWLCDNGCLCSAETVVDTLSCMCCVKEQLQLLIGTFNYLRN